MKKLMIFLAVFFYVLSISAQTESKPALTDNEITQLSSNLAMKLLLNDSQTSTLTNLLKTYRSDLSKVMGSSIAESQNKVMKSINDQIVGSLDSKQKMKFNVVGPDWWKSVQEAQNN